MSEAGIFAFRRCVSFVSLPHTFVEFIDFFSHLNMRIPSAKYCVKDDGEEDRNPLGMYSLHVVTVVSPTCFMPACFWC